MTKRGRPKKEFVKSTNDRKSDQRERDKLGLDPKCRITRYSAGGSTGGKKINGKLIASGVGLDALKEIIGSVESVFDKPNPFHLNPEAREREHSGFGSKWERGTAILNSEYTGKPAAPPASGTVSIVHNGMPVSLDDYHSLKRRTGPRCMTNVQAVERAPAGASVDIRQPDVPYAPNYLDALQDACEMAGTANNRVTTGRNLLPLEPLPFGKPIQSLAGYRRQWNAKIANMNSLAAGRTRPRRYKGADGTWRTWHVRDLAPREMKMAA